MTVDELTKRSTEEAARARAEKIRFGMHTYLETVEEIALAFERRDWEVLSYPSWEAYLDGEFGAVRLKLPEEHRQKAVTALRMAGMSTRAIGTALGISKNTAARTLASVPGGTDDLPATVRSLDGRERPATRPTPTPAAPPAGQPGPAPDERVWIATARKGIEAHALKSQASTRCSRSTRTGLTLAAGQATERHDATWCRKCWPPAPPTEEPCGRCGTVTLVGDLPGTPPRWCPECRFIPPQEYVTTPVTYGTLLPGDYIDRPHGPHRHVAWHQVAYTHYLAGDVTVWTDHGDAVPVHEDMAADLALTVRRPEGRTAAAISVVDCRECHCLVPAVILYNGRCPACLTAGDHAQMLEEKLAAQDPKLTPGPERTLPAGLLRAGDLVWVGPEGWQPATSVEIGPIPPVPGGWQVLARTRTGVHTATAQRTWRWDELLQIRRPVPATEADTETTRFAAGEPAPTGPADEAHDPRASREAGAESRDSAPAGDTDPLAGIGDDYEPDPARRIAAVAEVALEYLRPVEPTETATPGRSMSSPAVDGVDTAASSAGDAAPAPAPPTASPPGGAGVTPGLDLATIARLRAAYRHLQAVGGRRTNPRRYTLPYASTNPALHRGGSTPVDVVDVQWFPPTDVCIRWLAGGGRYEPVGGTDFYPATVAQALDVLCALGILPAYLSTAYAGGVQAGLRAGNAIDGDLEADHA